MKRLSVEALEAKAFAERRLIEFDFDNEVAYLKVGAEEFYADLTPKPERALRIVESAWLTDLDAETWGQG